MKTVASEMLLSRLGELEAVVPELPDIGHV